MCRRLGICKKHVTGEAASVDMEAVEPFKIKTIVQENKIKNFKVYKADETGLLWKLLPMNTVASKKEISTPGT